MSVLRLINQTEIISSSSTVNITNVFSADFDVYKIEVSNMTTTGPSQNVYMRLINSAGSVITTSNYHYAYLSMTDYAAFVPSYSAAATSWSEMFGISYDNTSSLNGNGVAYIFNPYSSSLYTYAINETTSGSLRSSKGSLSIQIKDSITGFQLFDSTTARPFSSGLIKTYGLRKT